MTLFSLGVVVSFMGVTMWKQHFKENPDEYSGIQYLKEQSDSIDRERTERQREKLKRIEECRRLLDEQSTR